MLFPALLAGVSAAQCRTGELHVSMGCFTSCSELHQVQLLQYRPPAAKEVC